MKFFIKSFGCQYNEWDAARLSFVLKEFGLAETSKDDSDIVFLLNCSVRETGVDRALGLARNLIAEGKKVVVSGCVLANDRKKFEDKGVILWNGNDVMELSFLRIPPLLPEERLGEVGVKESSGSPIGLGMTAGKTNLIPIMKGCNNFCSYCAVPYTRGREISRPMEEILNDVRKVIEAGNKKVILIGQNVNSYQNSELRIKNSAEKEKRPFAILLEKINAIPDDFTIEFTSNHPKDMSDDIIEAMATLPKIEKTIHLPLQSGSNKILKAMNRPYTREQYIALIEKIKKRIPEIRITTDTIVGFPGETEEDFQETVDIFRRVEYFAAYNNKYSPRSGTKAFALGDPISWAEKQRRWRILNDISYHKK